MISRLETMVLMGIQLPAEAIRRQIAAGVEILVHLGRRSRKRRVLEIAQTAGYQEGEVCVKTLYAWNDRLGILEQRGELLNREKLEREQEE